MDITLLVRVIIIAHIFILVDNSYNLLADIYGFPSINIHEKRVVHVFVGNASGISSPNLQMLIFTTPFTTTLLFAKYINGKIGWPLLVLTIVVLVLSSRAMLMMAIAYSLFCIPLMTQLLFRRIHIAKYVIYVDIIMIIVIAILIVSYYDVFFKYYINQITDKFDLETDSERFLQREMLIKQWLEHPLVGYGLGREYYASVERGITSNFESQYHLELANTGLLGFLILLFCYISLLIGLLKRAKSGNVISLAFLAGFVLFLIANASNPFLNTFDRMLPLYLSLAAVNIPSDIRVR